MTKLIKTELRTKCEPVPYYTPCGHPSLGPSGKSALPLKNGLLGSVADPDPYDFGPPGSGSGFISQRYGSGSDSGSFYHQAKIVRNNLRIP